MEFSQWINNVARERLSKLRVEMKINKMLRYFKWYRISLESPWDWRTVDSKKTNKQTKHFRFKSKSINLFTFFCFFFAFYFLDINLFRIEIEEWTLNKRYYNREFNTKLLLLFFFATIWYVNVFFLVVKMLKMLDVMLDACSYRSYSHFKCIDYHHFSTL